MKRVEKLIYIVDDIYGAAQVYHHPKATIRDMIENNVGAHKSVAKLPRWCKEYLEGYIRATRECFEQCRTVRMWRNPETQETLSYQVGPTWKAIRVYRGSLLEYGS